MGSVLLFADQNNHPHNFLEQRLESIPCSGSVGHRSSDLLKKPNRHLDSQMNLGRCLEALHLFDCQQLEED